MDAEQYKKFIEQKLALIQKLQSEIILDTQEYLSDELNSSSVLATSGLDRKFDSVCFDSVLIQDMFDGRIHIHNTSSKDYKNSKLKKVRKVLGYNI